MSEVKKTTRDPESTRDKILDAALNIFAAKGYYDTRMDEIVDESGSSKGSIYFHFPNKERLFLALVDQFANLLERRVIESIDQNEEGIGRVRAALEAIVATFGRYRRPAKLMLIQAAGLGAPFEQKRQEINDRFARLIGGYLRDAIRVGDIAPVDVEVVSYAWMGAIYAVIIRWVYTGEPEPQRIVDALLPVLLKSVGHEDRNEPAVADLC
ncbi:MAG: TetR/AcrR family transcriptional regulator [Caldilineaceae bacterium]|nr:TetR/AcrR family transcriptional regulator [Caldilineaceae bacterium]MCB0144580.1 TetR/AcrR family transcriptional regulator [Caldilineaceae bacterium]